MNKVLLTGRLTRDPELRSLASGSSVATFAVATSEYRGAGKEHGREQGPEATQSEKERYAASVTVTPATPQAVLDGRQHAAHQAHGVP